MHNLVNGKFEFLSKDGKVILKGPGLTAELKFINILNNPGGKLRTKFSILTDKNGKTYETPIDIFISDWGISNIGVRFTGEERCSNTRFRVSVEYRLLSKVWVLAGSINGSVISATNKDLGEVLKVFSNNLNLH